MSDTAVTIHRAYRYRIDERKLSEETRSFFMQSFGCVRKVYNLYVDFLYRELEERGFTGGCIPYIKLPEVSSFKSQARYSYLKDIDSLALANAKISFQNAVKKYNNESDHKSYTKKALRRDRSGTEPLSFKGLKGMPVFHSRSHGDFSYTTNCQYPKEGSKLVRPTIRLEGDILYLPKLKKGVKLILHRPLPVDAVIGNVTISMEADGSLYASIGYSYISYIDTDIRDAVTAGDITFLNSLDILGLDYSQMDFYADSEGRKANYPHYYRKSEKRLKKLQRQLSRMTKGSNNYLKKLRQIQKLSRHITNERKDFLHKLSTQLVKEFDVIAVEDLNLRNLSHSLKLGKNLSDNGFGMFRNMLSYKLEEKGSCLIKIPRMYPSTKTCSVCGHINRGITLSRREWTCPICHAHHDRDINAAVNIRNEGMRILTKGDTALSQKAV